MSELGRNGITLTAVSDACSVVFSPSSCVVHADFDGSNPVLTYAYTDINVVRGDVKLAITTSNITIPSKSNSNITYSLTAINNYTVRLQITAIPTTILNGNLGVKVTLGAFEILSSFPFTVVRESSMLDWIQDWDGRRTSIGGASIVTPKIFAGSKDSDNSLTGVYLGPDTAGAGIYGYKAVPDPSNTGHTITSEVFHINSNGASIGGWNIETGGISTVDSVSGYSLQLLSSGSIIAKDNNGDTIYQLKRDGNAEFAKGNIKFYANGGAEYKGQIEAGSGKIGNWLISENAIHKAHVVLDSNVSAIMVLASDNYQNTANAYTGALKTDGGVKMYYTASGDYGLEAWMPATTTFIGDVGITQYHKAFSLGSTNWIAGWSFDDEKFGNTYAAIIGGTTNAGLYLATHDISAVANSGLTASIAAATGIYMTAASNSIELAGYAGGYLTFRLGTAGNKIAGWNFDNVKIWCGTALTDGNGFTTTSGSTIIGAGAIVGHKWRLNANGEGALAGGVISWTSAGVLTLNGGTIKSDGGNTPAWILNPDGTGHFVGGNLSWTSSTLTLAGTLTVNGGCVQLDNAGICSEGSTGTSVRFWAGCSHVNRTNTIGSTNGPKFKVTQDGTLYASDAHITGEIEATSGKIGGFVINGSTIQNYNDSSSYYNNNAALIFNDNSGIWAAIGTNTVSAVTGLQVPMAIRNHQDDDFGLSTNYAALFSARNAYVNIAINAVAVKGNYSYNNNFNYALLGSGNCVVEGAIEGYSIFTDSITASNTVKETVFTNSNFLIVSSSQSDSGFILPTISSIREFLQISGSNTTTKFHVTLWYLVNESSSHTPPLYGRSARTDGYWMADAKYPFLYNTSGTRVDSITLSKTKALMIQLWWDGTNYRATAI